MDFVVANSMTEGVPPDGAKVLGAIHLFVQCRQIRPVYPHIAVVAGVKTIVKKNRLVSKICG